jgi:CDP-glucose 4,6-dehydratase
MCSINGDVRDIEHLKATIVKYQPEIIIHMAAQSLVRYSYIDPIETYTTNVLGTVNVLEAVRQIKGARVVLIITSDKCYQNNEWQWGYRENEPMGGNDPYSSSKGCAEIIISAYRHSYYPVEDYDRHNVAIASARAGNVIGGGDWSGDRLIPDIIKAFMEDRPVIVRNPNAIRPWQHVLDPLNGYLCLIEKLWTNGPEFSSGWNFGPNDDVREVSWIVERMVKLWGENAQWALDRDKNPHEAEYLKLDCSKAKNILKWSPKLSLSVTLEWIIEWYRNYQQDKDMRYYTESEISRYEKLKNIGADNFSYAI